MLTPRYYFADDFREFHDYFLAQPHKETVFRKGELLWKPGQPYSHGVLRRSRRRDGLVTGRP